MFSWAKHIRELKQSYESLWKKVTCVKAQWGDGPDCLAIAEETDAVLLGSPTARVQVSSTKGGLFGYLH